MLTSTSNLVAAQAKIAELQGLLATSDAAKAAAEGKLATYEGTGEGSLSHFKAGLDAALASVGDLTGKLTKATDDLTAATSLNGAYKAAIDEGGLFSFANPEGGKPTLSLTDAGKAKLVNADAARTLASSGAQSLPLAVDNAPGALASAQNDPSARTKANWNKPLKGYEK